MALEIERRFLVNPVELLTGDYDLSKSEVILQGYINSPGDSTTTRIRRTQSTKDTWDLKFFMTLKKFVSEGVCQEIEFSISKFTFQDLLESCKDRIIRKKRFSVPYKGNLFEVDCFQGDKLGGLILAEVELPSLDHEIQLPSFLGKEITGIKGVSNQAMAFNPEKVIALLKEIGE